ncbi:hypothetical protein BJ322DRAFT_1035065 [Thelephora terrestris]|uniref:Uncharacterized protein n=1 Tax=Thelephora terrestris TaxID=56493 RepID=A0A9P6HSC9_9AGAM|nr:hypothetical protein BJ322DRAFT_1035065 [Thelephora terrestris]
MISVSPIESDSDGHGERGFTCSSSSSDSRTRLVSQSGRTGGERGIACTESSGSSSGAGPPEFLGRGRGDVKIGSSLLYPPAMTFDDSNPRQSLRPLPTPRTALNDSLQYRSSMPDFRHMRMHVDGRLQDFGPVLDCPKSFFAVSNPDTESEHDDDLPPDYDQATQPFPHSIHGSSPTVTPSSYRPPLSPWGR